MLYIDQPSQTGFSYTIPVPAVIDNHEQELVGLPNNSCPEWASTIGRCGTFSLNSTLTASDTIAAAPALWATLQGFIGVFPQYARNKINLASESYGGHYAPVFAEYFHAQTTQALGSPIDLDTVLIGNGWIDSSEVYQSYYNFTVSPGNTYDYAPFNESVSTAMFDILWGPGNCVDRMNACKATNSSQICVDATNFCQAELGRIYHQANRDVYDIREPSKDPFPPTYYEAYLNSLEIQTAIGAYQNFTRCSYFITSDFWDTSDLVPVTGLIEDFQDLIEQGINIVLYHGDADYICNWLGGERVAYEIDAPGFAQAGYENISTSDAAVHSQVKQAGSFSFVRVYEAGHEVPFY
jgi:carboxypeptidase C (cathepsin A)